MDNPALPRRRSLSVVIATLALAMLIIFGAVDFVFSAVWGQPVDPVEGLLAGQVDTLPFDLNSTHMVLLRVSDSAVLLSRGGEARIYPASMTKVMTVLIAVEALPDLEALILVEPDVVEGLRAQNAAMAGFAGGEWVRAIDLIYGALLPSGAEATVTLARHIGGTETAFAELMNARAAQLGMESTHFTNAWGAHDPEHYTTAADMAALMTTALENDTLCQALSRSRWSTAGTEQHPDGITVRSTLFSALSAEEVDSTAIAGGKTGYTKQAGQCLASYADIDGQQYVLVTAGASGSGGDRPLHVLDAVTVFEAVPALLP